MTPRRLRRLRGASALQDQIDAVNAWDLDRTPRWPWMLCAFRIPTRASSTSP